MPTIDDEIRSRTEAFATNLAVLVRQAALEAVGAALGAGATRALGAGATAAAPVQVTAKRGRGRPRKSAAVAPAPTPPATPTAKASPAATARGARGAKSAAAPRRAAGEKRPPAELEKLIEKLGEYIKAHPGVRMEVMAKAIGTPARELRFPVTKLIASKKIRAQGQKRGTEYFPL
jgi:hypothetical protein